MRQEMIFSPDDPGFVLYNSRAESGLMHRNEPEPGLFIAESRKCITRALAAGYQPVSALCETGEDLTLFVPYDIPVYLGERALLEQLAGYSLTGGMLCALRRQALPTPEELLTGCHRIVVADDVENPVNIGSIIRNAAALYADAMLVTADSSDPLYRRASRVSMGTVFGFPWTKLPAGEDYIELLHGLGFKVCAMALTDESVPPDEPALLAEEKLAIVLGNEGNGLKRETIARCDYTVCIPMSREVDSLNVAAASAVAFWQLCRRA